jgi:hypothetical protein
MIFVAEQNKISIFFDCLLHLENNFAVSVGQDGVNIHRYIEGFVARAGFDTLG